MRNRLATGFTLLELITTLAVGAITLGIGVPIMGGLINGNKVTGQINELRGALALTRSEAIRRNTDVVMCKSADGHSCTSDSNWENGWIIFEDPNRNRKRDPKESILGVHSELTNGHTLAYRGTGSFNHVTYKPDGGTHTNGTFTLCAPDAPERSKALILIRSGRVRLSNTQSDGRPLDCDITVISGS